MFDKLINNNPQADIDNHNKFQRKNIRESLKAFKSLSELILDDSVQDSTLRQTLFDTIGKEVLLATIMVHGCNIGLYTMAQLIDGFSYNQIKTISEWMMTEEAQRGVLAQVVNAISQLDITQAWGEGRSSSSDGQRFAMNRKVLRQTYSPKFNDFALEFYSFVADNYAPLL